MQTLANLLALKQGEVASIIGCGGKTTLLWSLAHYYKNERVLVSTTTKIGRPPASFYDSITPATQIKCFLPPHSIKPGVHVAGTLYAETGHIKSLPLPDLAGISKNFDKVLLEADGSRTLPLKGWADHEPVVPDFSTATIGIATIHAEGALLDENTVHRPEIFCRITGAKYKEPIRLEHIAAGIAHPAGLMARAKGRKILLFNQLDDEEAFRRAHKIVRLLPQNFLSDIHIIIGASLNNKTAIKI